MIICLVLVDLIDFKKKESIFIPTNDELIPFFTVIPIVYLNALKAILINTVVNADIHSKRLYFLRRILNDNRYYLKAIVIFKNQPNV